MLVGRVNVTFHDSDRVVAQDFRKRRQVDPLFSHACREGMTEVVENQIQLDAGFARLLAEGYKIFDSTPRSSLNASSTLQTPFACADR